MCLGADGDCPHGRGRFCLGKLSKFESNQVSFDFWRMEWPRLCFAICGSESAMRSLSRDCRPDHNPGSSSGHGKLCTRPLSGDINGGTHFSTFVDKSACDKIARSAWMLYRSSFPVLTSSAHLEIPASTMKFFSCIVVLTLTVATTCSANTVEETGVKARHMLAMGDESIMFARGSLRKEEETD
ncbi:hypothetical protein GQ600_26101 [Phytophthora cactorum]|nr:hypothetical protein GQ600_26101 [Phytophthora cactorum]